MPIYNWVKVYETSDLGFLLKERTALNKFQTEFLANVWKNLQDQYLLHFGIGEAMERIIEKERNLILLNEDYVVNDNKDQLTFIELAEIEIDALKSKIANHKVDFYITKGKVEKAMNGKSIDMHRTSVKEYYSYFKALSEDGNQE